MKCNLALCEMFAVHTLSHLFALVLRCAGFGEGWGTHSWLSPGLCPAQSQPVGSWLGRFSDDLFRSGGLVTQGRRWISQGALGLPA